MQNADDQNTWNIVADGNVFTLQTEHDVNVTQGNLVFDNNASGTLTMADGDVTVFTGIEKISLGGDIQLLTLRENG